MQINKPVAYRVDIIESQRGWGSKIDEIKYFDNEPEAKEFCRVYNLDNDFQVPAPDWYMIAQYVGKV